MSKAKSVEEAVDNTLLMCWSILRSEHMVTPRIHMASTLDAPGMIVGMCLEVVALFRWMIISLVVYRFKHRSFLAALVTMFLN